ncbi:MAG: ACP S-malonyltransferase [Candidatus Caenarcaniphilales bacterium]|nr:ACP S-malonyltransferase [Candidatus Caenarcaniphilales bacterium]
MTQINHKKIALVFPGQGSQMVGMGEEICRQEADAKNAFETVMRECSFDLVKLSWVGPEEALRRTCHAQPALLATSAACLQALRRHWTENPLCVAGHSLGEISALWSAGAIKLTIAAQITVKRGQLMEQSPPGAMSAVLGADQAEVEKLCADQRGVVIANYNTPQQLVLSGDAISLKSVNQKISTELKAKVIELPVGGAFHSPLMKIASEEFASFLDSFEFQSADCPVIQNIDALPSQEPIQLKANLKKQMTGSVQWVKSVQKMLELGAETFIEIGSGKVLSGLIKKIDRSVTVLQVSDPASLSSTLETLGISAVSV